MKVRNIFAAVAFVALGATTMQAANIEDLRIYINPGHGSWTGNDRAMTTVKHGGYNSSNPDTTNFFESNTNLWKCFGMLDRLVEYGIPFDRTLNQTNSNPARLGAAMDLSNNIVMSRVKNGPFPITDTEHADDYNRSLYEICVEAERNNFDFFLSVHSNAHVDGNTTNYPAFFVRGENKVAFIDGVVDVCHLIWPYVYQDQHACWSNFSMSNTALYYDIDFWHGDYAINNIDGKTYKGYYGVLRHGVFGFLTEGYFHTYQPARHRYMNPDVCRLEGDCYARGVAAHFGIPLENNGTIYGIVRDLYETFQHPAYNRADTSLDALKPINEAEVILYKDGVEKARYTTDDEYNGAFVFSHLEPGEYTIAVSAAGYKDAFEDYCGPFTVTAAQVTYPLVYLVSESYIPPAVDTEDYPDEAVEDPSIVVADSYNFKRNFTDKTCSALKGTTVKRLIHRGGRLYAYATDDSGNAKIVVINGTRLTTLVELDDTGCEGSSQAIADIAVTNDGYLVACAEQACDGSEAGGTCNIYRWSNDAEGCPIGAPKLWLTTNSSANFASALTGGSILYSGTLDAGVLLIASKSTAADQAVAFTRIEVTNNEKTAESVVTNANGLNWLNASTLGQYTITMSPLSTDDAKSLVVQSPLIPARQLSLGALALESEMQESTLSLASAQGGFFRFAGHSLMVAPTINADGNSTGVQLMDISNGLNNAKVLNTSNTVLPKTYAGPAAATGAVEVDRDDAGNITGAYITMWMLRENARITRFTTRGVEQPAGVNDIVVDNNTPVEYFNLQGIAVDSDNLTPGIYIRRQGSQTTKVIIR